MHIPSVLRDPQDPGDRLYAAICMTYSALFILSTVWILGWVAWSWLTP